MKTFFSSLLCQIQEHRLLTHCAMSLSLLTSITLEMLNESSECLIKVDSWVFFPAWIFFTFLKHILSLQVGCVLIRLYVITPLLSPQALLTTTGIVLTVGAGGWHTAWEENLVQLLFHYFRGSLAMRWMPFAGVVYGEINPVMKGLCRSLIKLCYYLSTVCSVGDAVSFLI